MYWNRKKNRYGILFSSFTPLWGLLFLLVCLACPASGQHYAYITNAGELFDGVNDDLSIIDLSTNTVIGTVPVGDYPQGVAVNPAGTAVYVANTVSSEFTVIDTATHTSTTLPAGSFPAGVAIHPNGRYIYLTNIDFPEGLNSTVSVIDRATNTIVDDIVCGNGSIGVAVHPYGTVAYVSNISDGTVAVFDTNTHEVLERIELEPVDPNEACGPVPIVVNPRGTYVYVANRFGPSVWAINTATHEFTARAFGQAHVGIAVDPKGAVLYVPDYDDSDPNLPAQGTTVAVIDTETLELITTIDGLNAPVDVSVHPDGTRIYVTNEGNDTVSVIDSVSYAQITTIAVGSKPNGYGECVGPGVPRLLKEDAVARLQAVKDTIAGDAEGVISPQYAIENTDTALDSGNICLQENLWSASDTGQVDPRRLQVSQGSAFFEAEQTMVKAVLDAIRRGWIVNAELRSELLAVTDEAVSADRVLAAVAIDDAIVGGKNSEAIEQAQALLENGDALVTEAKVWELMNKKADLLSNAISEYQKAWQAALD